MNFREAKPEDIPFMLALLQDFYRHTGGIYEIPFDRVSTVLTIGEVMARGICLVGPSSCAGAIIVPFRWNHEAKVAEVVFWRFRAAREVRIFDALMAECRKAGATHIAASSHFPDNTVGRYYSKKGLHRCDSSHIRRL